MEQYTIGLHVTPSDETIRLGGYEETIYGIDGVLTWPVNGKQIDVGPRQALCIPRGAIHRFDNNART
jgi:mannose-6-phosphate isomerase-like protein (cupin superfamily)